MSETSVNSNQRIAQVSDETLRSLKAKQHKLDRALKRPDTTYLVIPSVSIHHEEVQFIERAMVDYEHRLLWLLNRAERGRRVVFVSSLPTSRVATGQLLACASACSHGQVALETISLEDTSSLPLIDKLLARQDWLKVLKQRVTADDKNVVLVPFMATEREFQLADILGIPVVATPNELNYLGTKSGSRKVCRKAGLIVPDGFEDLQDEKQIVEAADELWFNKPSRRRVVVKVNEGISGYGNGILPLPQYDPTELSATRRHELLKEALTHLQFQTYRQEYEFFMSRIGEIGGIVEDFLEGEKKSSPSGQAFLWPDFYVELLSTHEQLLTGPDGMVYDGALFPATDKHIIGKGTLAVGEILSAEGAMGYYGVDFIKVDGKLYAIEINLRQGGTTHLRAHAMLSTGAEFDPKSGNFIDEYGRNIFYAGSDGFVDPRLKTLSPNVLLEHFADLGLRFRRSTRKGVIFHLLDSINRSGTVGITVVSDSRNGARSLFRRVTRELRKLLSQKRL